MSSQRAGRALLVALPLLVLGGAADAQPAAPSPPLVLGRDAVTELTVLDGHVDVLFDPGAALTFDEVVAPSFAARFVPVGNRPYGKPFVDGAAWLRFTIVNGSDRPIERILQIPFLFIDELDVYVPDGRGGVQRWRAGEGVEHAARAIPSRVPRFPLSLAPGAQVTIYLRAHDEGQMPVPLVVGAWPAIVDAEGWRESINTLLVSVVVLVLLYCSYHYARFRQRVYGWFVLAQAGVLAVIGAFVSGTLRDLAPPPWRPWVGNRLVLVTLLAGIAFLVGFLRELLAVRERFPRLDRALARAMWFYPVAAVLVLLPPFLVMSLLVNVGLLPLVALLGAALVGARGGDRVAALTAAAIGVLLVGAALTVLRAYGILPHTITTEYAPYFGFLLHIVALTVAAADRLADIQRQREQALQAQLAEAWRNAALSRTFERFVPKQFLERLERRDITDIDLGQCVAKEMSTLFSDIRSFTTLVERMTPEQNFAFINEYLAYMEPAIHAQHGFIDKYIGDAVMALFDVDAAHPDPGGGRAGAAAAVGAAVAMQRALDEYNRVRAARGEAPIEIGVGVHTGRLMLGTIGGRDRLNASVIGDAVNLASRVEGMTKMYGARILVTEQTTRALPEPSPFSLRVVDRVRVKGKREPVTVYEVLDGEADGPRAAKRAGLAAWQAGWARYQARDFAGAIEAFSEAERAAPDDPLPSLLIERCRSLTVGDDWDGAVTLTSK